MQFANADFRPEPTGKPTRPRRRPLSGGFAGGKAAAGAVILAGSARFVLSGLYELTSNHGVEHEAGVREQL